MLPRQRFCSDSSEKQCIFSNSLKLLVDLDPFYFFKYSDGIYIFLEISVKSNTELKVSKEFLQINSVLIYSLYYKNDLVGYAITTSVPVVYSGSYIASISSKKINKHQVDISVNKFGHIAAYSIQKDQFILVSTKMSSAIETILEEQ